jgi:hypothetical protein
VAYTYYFLNLFRPYPARPTRPVPSSISVAGSGTGTGLASDSETSEVATGVEVVDLKLDVVAGSSDEGQPTIPKNIITTHKTIKIFFICFPFIIENVNIIIPSLALSWKHNYT